MPWFERKDKNKICRGLGNPCAAEDMSLFYATTTMTVETAPQPSFGRHHDLMARNQRNSLSRKPWKPTHGHASSTWMRVFPLTTSPNSWTFGFTSVTPLLWRGWRAALFRGNLTDNSQYSAASAYKAQFFGVTSTNMKHIVWKIRAPPKINYFCLACSLK